VHTRAEAPFAMGIDVHHHLIVPSYISAALEQGAADAEWASSHTTVTAQQHGAPAVVLEGRAEDMRAAGIGTALLSVTAVVFRARQLAVRAAHDSNRELLAAARTDPEHFHVMASLPVPFADACLAELEDLRNEDLVSALIMPVGTADWTLDNESFLPVWQAIAETGLPVMLHPSLEPWPPAFRRWRLGPGIGVPVETSLAALNLIFSGTLDMFPELTIIVPQLGGVLPYLTQRLLDRGQGDAKHDVAHYLRDRIYYDNNSYHRPALACAIDTVGANRIVLGSDYPFRGTLTQCVQDITGADLSATDKNAILDGNARSILHGLTAP